MGAADFFSKRRPAKAHSITETRSFSGDRVELAIKLPIEPAEEAMFRMYLRAPTASFMNRDELVIERGWPAR